MTSLLVFGYILSTGAASLAWVVAQRDRDHRPVALLLTTGLVVDIARRILHVAVLGPAHKLSDPDPLTGLARLAGHLDSALVLAWPAGSAAVAVVVFLGRRPWVIGLLYVTAVIALVFTYPLTRDDILKLCYIGASLAAVIVALGCGVVWSWRLEGAELRHRVVALIAATEFATLLGPWRIEPFERWDLAQVMYAALYAVLIVRQGGSLWKRATHSG